jgi:hypothetical protein
MKISSKTVSLLQSFAQISPNLLVKVGNKLATRNASNSIQARAVVDETFPRQFAIYDLSQFLTLLSMSQTPDIELYEKHLEINHGDGRTHSFYYADDSLVTAPDKKTPELEHLYSFKLTPSDINMIIKTASVVSATMMNIVSKNGKVTLFVNDPKNSTAHSFTQPLGDSDKSFDVKMMIDLFKIVPGEYKVHVSHMASQSRGPVLVFFFESTTSDLTYLVAADSTSKA